MTTDGDTIQVETWVVKPEILELARSDMRSKGYRRAGEAWFDYVRDQAVLHHANQGAEVVVLETTVRKKVCPPFEEGGTVDWPLYEIWIKEENR
jgi:hypothetical protein